MLQFVPRKVAHKASNRHVSYAPTTPSAPFNSAPSPPSPVRDSPDYTTKGKAKATETYIKDEDLSVLLWLSLSDHILWSNVDIRRTVVSAEDGWIPLSYLLQHSSHLLRLNTVLPDSTIVRAIRIHAQEFFEIRVLVTSPSKDAWYGKGSSSKEDIGGYEIRRRDWSDALTRVRNSTRHDWEARTVYVENIPPPYRSIASIYSFMSSILHGSNTAALTSRIQSIALLPHHLDRPGDVPKSKGFALVTFVDAVDATRLVSHWPWLPRRTSAPDNSPVAIDEALKYGFRTLQKMRWDELKEEYLAYRQKLLDDLASPEDAIAESSRGPTHAVVAQEDIMSGSDTLPAQPSLDPYAPFPPGCLVFVRNVHPETNKTTLKTLFASHAFRSATSTAIDYVDYTKGITSCHLRLSTPHHAQTLASAFQASPLVQIQGLDSAGSSPLNADSTKQKPLSAEVVDGEREALYWHKVPEKVRREAVRKAIAQVSMFSSSPHTNGDMNVGDAVGGHAIEDAMDKHGKRPRKRRRKA